VRSTTSWPGTRASLHLGAYLMGERHGAHNAAHDRGLVAHPLMHVDRSPSRGRSAVVQLRAGDARVGQETAAERSALTADPVVVPVEAVRVGRHDGKTSERNVAAVQVRWVRRNADAGI
jgi:hypothetical protein